MTSRTETPRNGNEPDQRARRKPGTVYLVGAGPGHPGLLTLRGAECLGKADLVLYDYLANPSLVEHAGPRAELVRLGHHNGGPRMTPDQITAAMIDAALDGRCVVRLKGGDPAVFGRLADETAALRRLGIPFEVVPGITSGLALSAFAEVPVTHHDDASAVALVTGRERGGKDESNLDYQALAAFPGTLVFYMGVKRAARWSAALMDHGRSPDTPVAIVRWCSRARQQTVCCTLGTVAEVVESRGVRPPALFVVGEVVQHSPCMSWFETRPLFGSTVLVAGSARTAERLREQLAEQGAEVIVQPAIRVVPPPSWNAVDDTLDRIRDYDWLVFSTPNGVDALMGRILDLGTDARRLGGVKIAAIGKGTADRLRAYQLQPEVVPDVYEPTRLATRLIPEGTRPRFLMACGPDSPTLSEELEVFGGRVDELVVYDTEGVEDPDPDVALALVEREIDWVAVTSTTTARALDRLYGSQLRHTRIASISPLTSKVLRGLDLAPDAEASPPTVSALVDGITAAVKRIRETVAEETEAEMEAETVGRSGR
ncbi:MAG: uroporphyrinogen-III C-methyltransferase [Longimicrobiales bacterium]